MRLSALLVKSNVTPSHCAGQGEPLAERVLTDQGTVTHDFDALIIAQLRQNNLTMLSSLIWSASAAA